MNVGDSFYFTKEHISRSYGKGPHIITKIDIDMFTSTKRVWAMLTYKDSEGPVSMHSSLNDIKLIPTFKNLYKTKVLSRFVHNKDKNA